MVRRDEFDYYIAKQAQKQGAELRDRTKATGIEFTGTHWQVDTHSGQTFEGTYLIAADGGSSPTAKWLGFDQRKSAIAGAIEIEPKVNVKDPHTVHFEFGLLKNGYVWNFPKADGYSIGSGLFAGTKRKGGDLIEPTAQYAAAFDVDAAQTQKHGHPVYLWNGNQTLHTQNALLAGEAACVVDPFTAEGIRPSMFTGVKAAEAIDQALGGNEEAIAHYSRLIADEVGSEMKLASRLAKAFYIAPHISYRAILNQQSAVDAMVKIFTGELKYADMVNKALKRLSGGLLR